ncbi:hypothetical protein NCC49_005046 [Naganishia albida]|nr:hypothetical protein NCC49_005046 [Naganishia albida]
MNVAMSFATAGGSRLPCSLKGDMPIVLPSGREVLFQDVHLAPKSAVNLLSARQMSAKGCSVTMSEESAAVSEGIEVIGLTFSERLWIANFPLALRHPPPLWHRRRLPSFEKSLRSKEGLS